MTTLENQLNYSFQNPQLLERALTHKSYFNESSDKSVGHNEKLEFLGDAVLDLSLSHKLMDVFDDLNEGQLSRLRASLVNENALSELALQLQLDKDLKLGKGEEKSGGRTKPRLLACVFEALIGAYYLDAGFEKANKWIVQIFTPLIEQINVENSFQEDYKTHLQELTQEMFKCVPKYKVVNSTGPDHNKSFSVEVLISEKVFAEGAGKSKKQAEQEAARQALEKLK